MRAGPDKAGENCVVLCHLFLDAPCQFRKGPSNVSQGLFETIQTRGLARETALPPSHRRGNSRWLHHSRRCEHFGDELSDTGFIVLRHNPSNGEIWARRSNELRIHVARRGEQVTVLSRHTTDDGPGWVEAKAAT